MPRGNSRSSHSLGGGGRSSSGGRSSGGGMFSRSSGPARSTMAPSRPAHPPPQQHAPTGGMIGGGLGSTLMTGMAFGAGSEVAHQAVRGIMGGGSGHGGQVDNAQAQQQAPAQYG